MTCVAHKGLEYSMSGRIKRICSNAQCDSSLSGASCIFGGVRWNLSCNSCSRSFADGAIQRAEQTPSSAMVEGNKQLYATLAIAVASLLVVGYLCRSKLARSLGLSGPHLDPKIAQPFKLVGKKVVSDSATRPVLFLTLQVPTGELPTGSHVALSAEINGKMLQRSYTPTRFSEQVCELMLRVYPDGAMTQYLIKRQVGEMIMMRGPTGIHRYEGAGTFTVGKNKITGLKRVGMLAGGTGITPMLQIANRILRDAPQDSTQLQLLAANSSVEDIMLYERLNQLAADSKGQLSLEWTVSKAPPPSAKWQHLVGRISKEMLQQHLPAPSPSAVVCLCGPPAFNKAAKELLAEVGHAPGAILTWHDSAGACHCAVEILVSNPAIARDFKSCAQDAKLILVLDLNHASKIYILDSVFKSWIQAADQRLGITIFKPCA
eukprot:g71511.t1